MVTHNGAKLNVAMSGEQNVSEKKKIKKKIKAINHLLNEVTTF